MKDVKITGPKGRTVKVKAVTSAGGDSNTRYFIESDPLLVHGNYKLTIGPAVADLYGSSLDGNANLILGEKDDASVKTLTETEDVYRSTKGGALADGKGTSSYDPVQTVFKIKLNSLGTLSRVRVGFDISHTYASDLRISLVSPKGTTVS